MRKEIVIGICLFVAGVLCACLFGYEYFSTYGFLGEYHIKAFTETEIDFGELFVNILWERGKIFLLIWVATCTPARNIVPLILRCGIFFTVGMFAGACMIAMGFWGLVLSIGAWIPHGILYLLAVWMLVQREKGYGYGKRCLAGRRFLYALTVIFFILFGCALEATLGSRILKLLFSVALVK